MSLVEGRQDRRTIKIKQLRLAFHKALQAER